MSTFKYRRVFKGAAVVAIATAVSALGITGAQATITGTSGAVVKVPAPASVLANAYESDTEIRAFDERRGITLASPVAVDLTTAGTFNIGTTALTPGTIPAGTLVSSHLLHSDPVGSPDPTGSVKYDGSVTFDGQILGIMVIESTLDASDVALGALTTLYPTTIRPRDTARGLEPNDVVVSDNLHTVSVHFVGHRLDQIRVVTTVAGCRGGGGLTPGFWSNKNGQALIGADDLALLTSLNLRNANGTNFDPATKTQFKDWLLASTATNMAYKLSSHLAAMELNVLNGFVKPAALVNTPWGVKTIGDMMSQANAALGANGSTPTGSPDRAMQEALKNVLDQANNNLNFVTDPSVPAC